MTEHTDKALRNAADYRAGMDKGWQMATEQIAAWLETNGSLCYTPREFAAAIRRGDWKGET